MEIFDKKTASEVAGMLLEIEAIRLQPNNPFTWASGWKSPIYCDNRLISYLILRSGNLSKTN
jgi:orotate phosphoribosyltransferase